MQAFRASDPETLQCQIHKIVRKQLSLSRLELVHGRPDKAADHWIAGRGHSFGQAQWTAAFVQRLRELGWVEGQTVAIEYRWGGGGRGRPERSPEIIAEFVRLKVDVIVTHATPNVLAAKQVTSVVPIVFPSAGDPVGNSSSPALRARAVMSQACRSSHPSWLQR